MSLRVFVFFLNVLAIAVPQTHAAATTGSISPMSQNSLPKEFISDTGCRIYIPANYHVTSKFDDDNPDVELIILYSKGSSAQVWEDRNRLDSGAITIEVTPLSNEERKDPAFSLKTETKLQKNIKAQHWTAVLRWAKGMPLNTLLLKSSKPAQMRAYLFGKTRLYKFSAYEWTPAFAEVIRGFREPHE